MDAKRLIVGALAVGLAAPLLAGCNADPKMCRKAGGTPYTVLVPEKSGKVTTYIQETHCRKNGQDINPN